jgi:hypothetical protein
MGEQAQQGCFRDRVQATSSAMLRKAHLLVEDFTPVKFFSFMFVLLISVCVCLPIISQQSPKYLSNVHLTISPT